MEETVGTLLVGVLEKYGPGALIGLAGIGLYFLGRKELKASREELAEERKAHAGTTDKLMELSRESIKADTEHNASLRVLTEAIKDVDKRLDRIERRDT